MVGQAGHNNRSSAFKYFIFILIHLHAFQFSHIHCISLYVVCFTCWPATTSGRYDLNMHAPCQQIKVHLSDWYEQINLKLCPRTHSAIPFHNPSLLTKQNSDKTNFYKLPTTPRKCWGKLDTMMDLQLVYTPSSFLQSTCKLSNLHCRSLYVWLLRTSTQGKCSNEQL